MLRSRSSPSTVPADWVSGSNHASYRITGNFLNWVTQNHDKEIARKLNAAAREGKYAEALWKDWTGKTLPELGDEWKKDNEARLAKTKSDLEKREPSAK